VRPGRVELWLDGKPWRVVPDEVVLRAGLAAGVVLDRPRARRLRAELRRAEALSAAATTLARRDRPRAQVEERLRRAGTPPPARREALETLERLGAVDDSRAAAARARALAARGWGDAALVELLLADGFDEETARGALAGLEPEVDRARRLAAREPAGRRAWALLARRGFAPESADAVLGALDEDP
jgi:SOS response regulatory protein OraA/RecX